MREGKAKYSLSFTLIYAPSLKYIDSEILSAMEKKMIKEKHTNNFSFKSQGCKMETKTIVSS